MSEQNIREMFEQCSLECEEVHGQAMSNLTGAIIKAGVCLAEGAATLSQAGQTAVECLLCYLVVPAPDGKIVEVPLCALCIVDIIQSIDGAAETIDCIWEVYNSFTTFLSQLNEADACSNKCIALCEILVDQADEHEAMRAEIEEVMTELEEMKTQMEGVQSLMDELIDEVIQFEDVPPEDIEVEDLR